MGIKKNESLLENERVKFLLRRMTERASIDFRKMLNLTVSTYGDKWHQFWQNTLPKIRTWSPSAINAITEEFEKEVHDARALTEYAYLRYVCLGYGKDAYGNKNKLEVEIITFGILYHAFMIRLARTPEMVRGSWFNKPDEMDRIGSNALCDALHDVSSSRVRILTEASPPKETTEMPAPKLARSYSMVSAVTPDDSASQVNSLGIRHQKASKASSAMTRSVIIDPDMDSKSAMKRMEEEDEETPPEPAPPRQEPRIIAFGSNIVKPQQRTPSVSTSGDVSE